LDLRVNIEERETENMQKATMTQMIEGY